jgi:Carboxypeptidase regulatory-like domain/TonB-dependent Receptor Plug Domain
VSGFLFLHRISPVRRTLFLFLISLVLLSFFGLPFTPTDVSAQNATIRGFVTDLDSGQSLPNANVRVIRSDGTIFGTVANNDGFYAISKLVGGTYIFQASFVGYKTHVDTLRVGPTGIFSLSVALATKTSDVGEVVVDAQGNTGAASITAGLQTILPAEIELIPSPDINGDLASYLSALPGFVTIGDQGGQFFIRGGEPWQNLVQLDGMVIYQPFHILVFFSAFPTEILNSVDVYAGGYGAKYGGRISSVIDVKSRNGNLNRFSGSASLSTFLASATLEGPIDRRHQFSFLASVRKSIIQEGAARLVNQPIPYEFSDFFGKVYGELNENSRVSVSYIQTSDRGVQEEDVGVTPLAAIAWQNQAIGARYVVLPGHSPILADFTFSYSRLKSELGPEGDPTRTSLTSQFNTAADLTFYGGVADIRWGLFARTLKLSTELDGLYQNLESKTEYLTEVGIYVEPDFKPRKGLTLSPSLRIHAFPSKRNTYIEPRFRVVWEQQKHTFSGAAGLYHQEVVGVTDRRDATSIFTAWSAIPNGGDVPAAVHLILGYGFRPTSEISLSAEVYQKWYSNLFIAEWTGFPQLTTNLQTADGSAQGVDLRLELQKRHVYGHLTYGLSWVEYEAQQPSLELWFGSNSFPFRPAHDRRHQVNFLLGTRFAGLNITARWQFGSGLPYTRAQGFDGLILLDDVVDLFEEPGSRRVIYEKPFNGELPTYHRLDMSADYSFEAKTALVTLQASILNVYNRKNIFYVDVFTQQRTDQLPFVPSLGIKVSFR